MIASAKCLLSQIYLHSHAVYAVYLSGSLSFTSGNSRSSMSVMGGLLIWGWLLGIRMYTVGFIYEEDLKNITLVGSVSSTRCSSLFSVSQSSPPLARGGIPALCCFCKPTCVGGPWQGMRGLKCEPRIERGVIQKRSRLHTRRLLSLLFRSSASWLRSFWFLAWISRHSSFVWERVTSFTDDLHRSSSS